MELKGKLPRSQVQMGVGKQRVVAPHRGGRSVCLRDKRDYLSQVHHMAKGSQLSQLKSALSQAGVNGPNGKKKKSTPLTEHAKVKKAAKLREIQQRLNPFDVKVTRLKHDIGGRRIRGTMGRPAQSKQAGMQQVETPLLSSCDVLMTCREKSHC